MGARRRRRRWDDAPLALSWMQAHTLGQPDTLSAQTAPATPKKGRILDRETTKRRRPFWQEQRPLREQNRRQRRSLRRPRRPLRRADPVRRGNARKLTVAPLVAEADKSRRLEWG